MTSDKPDPVRVGIAWQDPAMMQVGKSGVTDGLIEEAKRLLKKHKYVKVRLLRSSVGENDSKQALFENLCAKAGAKLIGIRGNTAVMFRVRSMPVGKKQ
ncbi:MAG: RNA-binding protein [Candidatus Thorarchaeota archaeon]|nr:MAG: RNA-binding protein [Candidatus Thorarchaeota archaeon]